MTTAACLMAAALGAVLFTGTRVLFGGTVGQRGLGGAARGALAPDGAGGQSRAPASTGTPQPSPGGGSASAAITGAIEGGRDRGLGAVGLWAADWSGGAAAHRSAAGWEAAAHNDSILIGQIGTYKQWTAQLHAWNPKLIILAYNLGPYLQKGSAAYNEVLSQHPAWFAHDSHGRMINLPMFPGNYLMDVGNAQYRSWHAQQAAASIAGLGFDGVMVDSVGDAVLNNYASSPPVNPATGHVYTATTWLNDEVQLLNGDKAALHGGYLAFNGLVDGTQYALESHVLAQSDADAGVAELFVRQATSSINDFPSVTATQQTLQMMSDLAARGKTFLGWTKVWVNASQQQLARWEQFALGVYLLGKQGPAYLDFMPSQNADNTVVSYANLGEQLGAPLNSYQQDGAVFTRHFHDGTVTLNLNSNTAQISNGTTA